MDLTAEQLTAITYAVHDDDTVWGTGPTPESAWADCLEFTSDSYHNDVHANGNGQQTHEDWAHDGFSESACTPAAARHINNGGSGFGVMPDGRIGTIQEAYDAA